MPRIDFVMPEDASGETREVYDQIRQGWGSLLTDFLLLGNSPQILRAVHELFHAIQGDTGGSVASLMDKELVAIKTSHMNGCAYCLGHNVDFGQAVGLTLEQIQAAVSPGYAESDLLSDREKALLRWTETVTLNTAADDDEAFARLAQHYSDAEIAELTLMSGLFNMWNRFTSAIQIELEPAAERELVACLARSRPVEPQTH
jgi:uncharacterized peroxidase-related enzyme